jgi:Glycosyl transferase family 2
VRLAMTLTVRDEADIIEDNLRYHRAQGVDFFVVGDNGSVDGTLEILERHEAQGIVTLERFSGGWSTMLEEGATRMARLAAELGADWVIHNDADEFWWPLLGNLKESLAAIPERSGMVLAPRTEFVARPDGDESFAERLTVRETRFVRPPRAAHRAHPRVTLWTTHPIDVWVDRGGSPRQGLVGKPALRAQAGHQEEQELELAVAPIFPLEILHFPLRSFDQYRRKVELARREGRLDRDEQSREVLAALEQGRLEDVYRELALDDAAVARGIAAGWLVEDRDFRDYFIECPAQLDGGPSPPGSSAWPEERRRSELEARRFDGMYVISRYLQTVAYKKQARRADNAKRRGTERRLRARIRQLRRRARRLRRIEASLWWRLRPRLPRARRRDH